MGASNLTIDINYVDLNNFTFDSALINFPGTKAELKDLTPVSSQIGILFNSINLNWAKAGSLTGTIVGTATIANGKLNCLGSISKGAFWQNAAIGALADEGTVRFNYTPGKTGAPSQNIQLAEFSNGVDNKNKIILSQAPAGEIRITDWDLNGVQKQLAVSIGGVYNTVEGVEQEIEFNFKASTGEFNIIIDGVVHGSITSTTYTRTGTAQRFQLGAGSLYNAADAEFDNVIIFSTRQHTAGYTPGTAVPPSIFSKNNPSILVKAAQICDAVESIKEILVSAAGLDGFFYTLNVNVQDKYFNTVSELWEDSDIVTNPLTNKFNTLAELLDNASSLDLKNGANVALRILLHSENGLTTPTVTTIEFGFNFYNLQSQPATATVFGFYRDVAGIGVEGATVEISIKKLVANQYREAGDSIIEKKAKLTTNSSGRFETDLIRTSEYSVGLGTYILKIFKADEELSTSQKVTDEDTIEFTVPDVASINITDQIN